MESENLMLAKHVRGHHLELLKEECLNLKNQGVKPHLKVILVGAHPPSLIYTRNKKKFCESFGAECEIINLADDIKETDFLAHVEQICENDKVHGCFVQLPLPEHLVHIDVGLLIPPEKDVDGFHPENLYALMSASTDLEYLAPCTPKGVMTMLDYYKVDLKGKSACVIGRSMIVGKPMAMFLTNANATVTLCHSRTENLKEVIKKSDIIVAAVGNAKFLTSEYLDSSKEDYVIVDVGMCHDSDGKLCGDVDFKSVKDQCKLITPVPGGVGPMTILSLAQNLLQAAKKSL